MRTTNETVAVANEWYEAEKASGCAHRLSIRIAERRYKLNMIAIHGTQDPDVQNECAHTLGRNSGQENAIPIQTGQTGANGSNLSKEVSPTLDQASLPAVALSCKDHGADAGEVSPTLRGMTHDKSHANGGGQVAVASQMQVRRLTPVECERLQGFPDNYTKIPWASWKKFQKEEGDSTSFADWLFKTTGQKLREPTTEDCPDGPRYKALGNSWAVPCARAIGEAIQALEDMDK